MTTAITNSPLNDGISSYAAIERLPRLTAEEEAQLLADLRLASRAPAAKARLIEGYLPRVLTLARQYDRRYRVITFGERQHDERCHQLVGLLDRLTARQRQILRLRYGLDPTDARAHSREEIGRLLGISPGSVYTMEQYALATLRHLYETVTTAGPLSSPDATATPPTVTHSRQPLTDAQQQYHQRRHAEVQAKLEAAFHTMQEQGLPITGETFKEAAQVNYRAACAFVRQHLPQSAERARLRAISIQQRLEEAFAGMVARGESLSITALKAAAHTDAPAVRAFLRSRGVPRLWGGPPRKASPVASQQTTGPATPLLAERSNSYATS